MVTKEYIICPVCEQQASLDVFEYHHSCGSEAQETKWRVQAEARGEYFWHVSQKKDGFWAECNGFQLIVKVKDSKWSACALKLSDASNKPFIKWKHGFEQLGNAKVYIIKRAKETTQGALF